MSDMWNNFKAINYVAGARLFAKSRREQEQKWNKINSCSAESRSFRRSRGFGGGSCGSGVGFGRCRSFANSLYDDDYVVIRPSWKSLTWFEKLSRILGDIFALIVFLCLGLPLFLFFTSIVVKFFETYVFNLSDGVLSSLLNGFLSTYCHFLETAFRIAYPYICDFLQYINQYLINIIHYLNTVFGS